MAMAGFVPGSTVADLPPGHMTWVAVERERVLLVNVDGTFYALQDACGHQRAPLSRAGWRGMSWSVPSISRSSTSALANCCVGPSPKMCPYTRSASSGIWCT